MAFEPHDATAIWTPRRLTTISPSSGCCYYCKLEQEAQLSQRDRATLLVVEYFAKLLKVIRNDSVE